MITKSGKQLIRQMLFWTMLCMLLFFLSVRVHAENKYQVTEIEMQGTLTTDSALNVRSGPGKDYDIIGKVQDDVTLHITGQTDDGWYQIELDGQTGYVSGQYVTAQETDTVTEEKPIGEPEEGYRGWNHSPQMKKIMIIGVIILVVLVMLVVTLKNMRREDEEDEYEDDDEDDEEEDEYDDEDCDEDEEDVAEEAVKKQASQRNKASASREYVIREEDYRIQIDPSFFEDKEFIEQPDMVTGYLERILMEENQEQELSAEKQKELDRAMEKLNELQKEIERLKNGN